MKRCQEKGFGSNAARGEERRRKGEAGDEVKERGKAGREGGG